MPSVVRRSITSLVMIGLLMFIIPYIGVAAYPEEGQAQIVIDLSHDQPLSPLKRNFTLAIDFFSNHTEYFVRTHTNGELTAENLTRTHILVIPNPGRNFSDAEQDVIANFVAAGGNLFLLGDYQTEDRPIGNPGALNAILAAISEERIHFTTFENNSKVQGDAIVDSINNLTLPFNVEVFSTQFQEFPNREIIIGNIQSTIIASGSLATGGGDMIVSKGANSSTAITINGQVLQEQPPWLAAYWMGEAKIVLCASTTMFSDTICVGTNMSWFLSRDNAILWYNIFKWLSISLIHDPTPIMIFFVSVIVIIGVGLFVYSIRRIRRGR